MSLGAAPHSGGDGTAASPDEDAAQAQPAAAGQPALSGESRFVQRLRRR